MFAENKYPVWDIDTTPPGERPRGGMTMNRRTITALKAVCYGCAINKRLEGSIYFNRKTKEEMDFDEAVSLVEDLIGQEEELLNETEENHE